MLECLFELDCDGIYSDWIKTCNNDSEELERLIGSELFKVIHSDMDVVNFSVLVLCNKKRVLSRDLIRFGKVL